MEIFLIILVSAAEQFNVFVHLPQFTVPSFPMQKYYTITKFLVLINDKSKIIMIMKLSLVGLAFSGVSTSGRVKVKIHSMRNIKNNK